MCSALRGSSTFKPVASVRTMCASSTRAGQALDEWLDGACRRPRPRSASVDTGMSVPLPRVDAMQPMERRVIGEFAHDHVREHRRAGGAPREHLRGRQRRDHVGFQKDGTLVFQNLSPLSCSLA